MSLQTACLVRVVATAGGVITLLAHGAVWADEQAAKGATGQTPVQVVESSPRGTLKNPYTNQEDKIAAGRELFQSYSCSGCHGGTGGGGMCPPVNGEVWFYGIDDDVLFRLVTLGSVE